MTAILTIFLLLVMFTGVAAIITFVFSVFALIINLTDETNEEKE
jgi:hypothetical protein